MILTDLRIARIMLSSITEATRKLTGTLLPKIMLDNAGPKCTELRTLEGGYKSPHMNSLLGSGRGAGGSRLPGRVVIVQGASGTGIISQRPPHGHRIPDALSASSHRAPKPHLEDLSTHHPRRPTSRRAVPSRVVVEFQRPIGDSRRILCAIILRPHAMV